LNSLATFVRPIFQTFALADCCNIERGVIDIFEGPGPSKKEFGWHRFPALRQLAFASKNYRKSSARLVLSEVLSKGYLASHVLPQLELLRPPIHLHLQIIRLKNFGQAAWIRDRKSW